MLQENKKISDIIDELGMLKASFDCALLGKGLYGHPYTPELKSTALMNYGHNLERLTDELEALCKEEGVDFHIAMLRVDIAAQETLRRARTPDASDAGGPTFL